MAHEAGFLSKTLVNALNHSNVSFICQKSPMDCGWWTTDVEKYRMAYAMRFAFTMNSVKYAKDMICSNPWIDESERLKVTKGKLEEQLPRYKIALTNVSSLNPHVSVSGKMTKEGKVSKTFTDDLAFCLSANLFFMTMIFTRNVPNFNYEELYIR